MDRHGKKTPGFDGYDCSTYKLSYRKTSETKCKSHHISTKALREVILYTIKNVCRYAIDDRDAFVRKVKHAMEERDTVEAEEARKKYDADRRRCDEVDKLYSKLYESFAKGIIPEDKFRMMSAAYEDEQKSLRADIAVYEDRIRTHGYKGGDIDDFYALVDTYTSFEDLTPQMLNEFVDKVLVHKAEKVDGRRVQKVEVYLNFVGNVDFPAPEKTAEEHEQEKIDEYWRKKYQRTKEYELARRKKHIEKENERIEEEKKAERERKIREFDEAVKTGELENMPVIPARLMALGSQNSHGDHM